MKQFCALAAVEQDSKKLLVLVEEINRLLERERERERERAATESDAAAWSARCEDTQRGHAKRHIFRLRVVSLAPISMAMWRIMALPKE